MGIEDATKEFFSATARVHILEVISIVRLLQYILPLIAGKTAITISNERSIFRIQKPLEVLVSI
jgi:hypothetical protein